MQLKRAGRFAFRAFGAIFLFILLVGGVLYALRDDLASIIFPAWKTQHWPTMLPVRVPISRFEGCNIILPVGIGDAIYPVVIDTGATASSLHRAAVEQHATIWPVIPSLLSVATLPNLKIGAIEFSGTRVSVGDPEESNMPSEHGVKGVLGSDFLMVADVIIDYEDEEVQVLPAGRAPVDESAKVAALRVRTKPNVYVSLELEVDHVVGEFLFDTGNEAAPVYPAKSFVDAHPDLARGAKPGKWGTYRVREAVEIRLGDSFEPLPLLAKLVPFERGPYRADQAGNLGCAILDRFGKVGISYANGEVWFIDKRR